MYELYSFHAAYTTQEETLMNFDCNFDTAPSWIDYPSNMAPIGHAMFSCDKKSQKIITLEIRFRNEYVLAGSFSSF